LYLIGRLGQNAVAKTAQNNREYVVLNIATQESWKNEKDDYETRTPTFTVKVVDVLPDGTAYNIEDNIQRIRYRDGYEKSAGLDREG
jgi:hypothetical protein